MQHGDLDLVNVWSAQIFSSIDLSEIFKYPTAHYQEKGISLEQLGTI